MNTPSLSEMAYAERQIAEQLQTIGAMARAAEDPATKTALDACAELLCAAVSDLQTAQREAERVIFGVVESEQPIA